jgi:hypothetical protein
LQKKSFGRVEETVHKAFNQNTRKRYRHFQFEMQVKKNVVKYVVPCNIPRNMQEMPKYVEICRIKFNGSNAKCS